MKKGIYSLFAVLLVVGIIAAGGTASDAMVALNGNTVSLNSSVRSDYDEKAIVEGEIYYVYDCIAVEEVTHTTYGIETGKDETNFYLIETYDKDYIMSDSSDYTPLTVIYSTADEDKIKKLDSMVEDWYAFEQEYSDWENDEEASLDDMPEFPSETFEIKGMITKFDDKKLTQYRDEYLEDIGYITSDDKEYLDTYCVDMIIQDTDPSSSKTIFFVGIAVALVGLIGLIVSIVLFKKSAKKKADAAANEQYDAQNYSQDNNESND